MNGIIFKGVEVATLNTSHMKTEEVGEEATQSIQYKEFRALVDKVFEKNTGIVEEVAKSTGVDKREVTILHITLPILVSRLR